MQRYEEFCEIINNNEGKRRYSTLYYPPIPKKGSDNYIFSKQSDRLDLLAYQYYGDSRYWVIIAKANKLFNPTLRIPVGTRLRLPDLSLVEIDEIFKEAQN